MSSAAVCKLGYNNPNPAPVTMAMQTQPALGIVRVKMTVSPIPSAVKAQPAQMACNHRLNLLTTMKVTRTQITNGNVQGSQRTPAGNDPSSSLATVKKKG